jgi:hypothetical protein
VTWFSCIVGEQDVGEHRALADLELAAASIVVVVAGDVGRQHILGELHAAEPQPGRAGEGLRQGRLGDAGDADQEHVPAGDQAHEEVGNDVVVADDDLPHRLADAIKIVREVLDHGHRLPARLAGLRVKSFRSNWDNAP